MKFISKHRFNSLPDAVLLDTDNTLYPYDPAHEAAQLAVKEKVTRVFSISPDEFEQAFSKARSQVHDRLKGMASSHSRLLYIQRMLEIMGLGSQALLALDFEQTYWRTFLSNAILFDDVKNLLEDFKQLRIPVSIVTDLTTQIQFRKIVYFELERYFDYIVTSEEVVFDKPHRAPFDRAVEKMKAHGKNIWMIGDNPINDILGAKKCINATTLQKIHPGTPVGVGECEPHASFENYSELRSLIKGIIDNE
jgi:HAD superfamily hydrolase (TIGR01549 family)